MSWQPKGSRVDEPLELLAVVRNDLGAIFYRASNNQSGFNWQRPGIATTYNWDQITSQGECKPSILFAGVRNPSVRNPLTPSTHCTHCADWCSGGEFVSDGICDDHQSTQAWASWIDGHCPACAEARDIVRDLRSLLAREHGPHVLGSGIQKSIALVINRCDV